MTEYNRFPIFRNSITVFHNTGDEDFQSFVVEEFCNEEEAEAFVRNLPNKGRETEYRTIDGIETVWYDVCPYCTFHC